MKSSELTQYIPNFQQIVEKVCNTSLSNFTELEDKTIDDVKLLCWSPTSSTRRKTGPITIYYHSVIGFVIHLKKDNVLFINNGTQKFYKLWKKSQEIKKRKQVSNL